MIDQEVGEWSTSHYGVEFFPGNPKKVKVESRTVG
jgi:hypothetical protein